MCSSVIIVTFRIALHYCLWVLAVFTCHPSKAKASVHARLCVLHEQSIRRQDDFLQLHVVSSISPRGAGSLDIRTGCRTPSEMLQPLSSLGFGRFCLTSSAFFQMMDWKLARFICWRRLSDVGGSPSFFCPFWLKSQYLTSFALLPAISFSVYRLHTKALHADTVSSLSVVSLPSCDTLVWWKSLLGNVLKACFLPIPNIELLESQPVSAWNSGNASHSCGPNSAATLCIGISNVSQK